MPSFYDLLKYAKTGIASPDMTAYDKMRALAMAGVGAIKTLTGVPPLSFTGNGEPLISWSMLGNSQQNGTPAPDAPIMPEFVGERTEQLASSYNPTGYLTQYTAALFADFDIQPNTEYTLSFDALRGARLYSNENIFTSSAAFVTDGSRYHVTLVTKSSIPGNQYISGAGWLLLKNASTLQINPQISNVMLNSGSTALPYEPYGWAIPITNAGQTQNAYLGDVQTARRVKKLVLTGDETKWIYEGEYERFGIPVYDMFVRGTRLVNLICSHYQCIDDGRTIGNVPNNSIYVVGGSTNMIFIKTNSYTTVDAFKTYLKDQYAAGTPVVIWYVIAEPTTGIVNEPLCKIGDYADTLDSADAGITIPTAKGANTLTVDTDLPPSSMTITYRG